MDSLTLLPSRGSTLDFTGSGVYRPSSAAFSGCTEDRYLHTSKSFGNHFATRLPWLVVVRPLFCRTRPPQPTFEGVRLLLDLARRASSRVSVRVAVIGVAAVALLAACTPLNSQEQYLLGATN